MNKVYKSYVALLFTVSVLFGILMFEFKPSGVYLNDICNSTVERTSNKPPVTKIKRCRVTNLECDKLFAGDEATINRSRTWGGINATRLNLNKDEFLKESRSNSDYCDKFISSRGYITENVRRHYVTDEERDFPLAFSILIYKDVEMFERLLRAVYRPQNFYCVHVDKKAQAVTREIVQAIAGCFANVFIPSVVVDVKWGWYTALEADLICIRELLKYKRWKYFINLTGQEFPLQSNLAMVQILKSFNGANNVEGTVKHPNENNQFKRAPPFKMNMTITRGAVHVAIRRAFAEYATYNKTAIEFLNWVKLIFIPDEIFFNTLNHNPHLGIPGSYLGEPESFAPNSSYISVMRYKVWRSKYDWRPDPDFHTPCAGKYVRDICILGVADLQRIPPRMELVFNKLNSDFEPAAYACLEELLCNRTRDELSGNRKINVTYYERLPFVTNHVK